jgi:protein-tyrosine phosphatase
MTIQTGEVTTMETYLGPDQPSAFTTDDAAVPGSRVQELTATTPALPGSILVVCTANLVRSPVARVFLDEGLRGVDISVASAGLAAREGQPMSPGMREQLPPALTAAADAASSRVLTRDLILSADLLLTATRPQRAAVVTTVPTALKRTFTLGEFAAWATALDARLALDGAVPPTTLAEFVARIPEVRATRRIADNEFDIDDPTGRSRAAHRRTFALIEATTTQIAAALVGTARRTAGAGLSAPR